MNYFSALLSINLKQLERMNQVISYHFFLGHCNLRPSLMGMLSFSLLNLNWGKMFSDNNFFEL